MKQMKQMKQFINVKGRILAVDQINEVTAYFGHVAVVMAHDIVRFNTEDMKGADVLVASISESLRAIIITEPKVVASPVVVAETINNGWRTFDKCGQPRVNGKYEALYEGDDVQDSQIRIFENGIWTTEEGCRTLFGSYLTEGESYKFIEPLVDTKIYHIGRDGQPKEPGKYNIFYRNDDSASPYRQLYFNGINWVYSEEHQSPTGFGNVPEDWNVGLGERYSKVA